MNLLRILTVFSSSSSCGYYRRRETEKMHQNLSPIHQILISQQVY